MCETVWESLRQDRLEKCIPMLEKLGVEHVDDVRHVRSSDLLAEGATLVQQRKFDLWQQQFLVKLHEEERGTSSSSNSEASFPPGWHFEEYVRKVLSSVLDTKVCKPNKVPRLQVTCEHHEHTEVKSATSQPDAIVQLTSGCRITVEAKDYKGKIPGREIEKLLSDQKSHKTEFALLVMKSQTSRVSADCRKRLQDHGVQIVKLEGPSTQESDIWCRDLRCMSEALSTLSAHKNEGKEEGSTVEQPVESGQVAQIECIEVWRVRMQEEGELVALTKERCCRREVHDMDLNEESGWSWLKVEFPPGKAEKNGPSKQAVDSARSGISWDGRQYYLTSVAKGSHKEAAVAWAASPPNGGGVDDLEKALGWGSRFHLEARSEKRPFPKFLLRARVKQLFSFSRPVHFSMQNSFNVNFVEDIIDEHGVKRTDGAAKCDPGLLSEAAHQLLGVDVANQGYHRKVPDSPQLRCGGLKGMMSADPRLKGTRSIEAPHSMMKFAGLGSHLRVVTYSVIRPTGLNSNALLRLEARGVPSKIFEEAQDNHLRRCIGKMTFRRACRLLHQDDEDWAALAYGWGALSRGGADRFGSFAEMLFAGFDQSQQPLLTVLNKERMATIKRAATCLHLPGCWSCRGVPEPKGEQKDMKDAEYILNGHEIFCRVPDADGTWRTLEGWVLVGKSVDLDPAELRMARAVRLPELEQKCVAGELVFSVIGDRLQGSLGWDFDGDYYIVIENPNVVDHIGTIVQPVSRSQDQGTTGQTQVQPDVTPPLVDVMAEFLLEFPKVDRMGLLHHQWQLLAGRGELTGGQSGLWSAGSEEAREVAAQYSLAVDVEKGGPRPDKPRHLGQEKWDFMKDSAKDAPKSRTAAGACYRKAMKLFTDLEKHEPRSETCNLKPDADLLEAWEKVRDKLEKSQMQKLDSLAEDLRSELMEKVKEDIANASAENGDNSSALGMKQEREDLMRRWMEETRERASIAAGELGADLMDLALVCWHYKYVRQEAAQRKEDHNQYPWTLFCEQLCEVKVLAQPCARPQLERRCRLLQDVSKAAKALEEGVEGNQDEDAESMLACALCRLRDDYPRMRCKDCRRHTERDHATLHLLTSTLQMSMSTLAPLVTEALNTIRRGTKEQIECSELRYAKASISRFFKNGNCVTDLVDKIVADESALKSLRLVGVRYHGEIFIVEGNRRLWAVREASRLLNKPLSLRVDVQDLFIGLIRSERAGMNAKPGRRLALHVFFEKFTTQNAGASVAFEDSLVSAAPCTESQSAGSGKSEQQHEAPRDGISQTQPNQKFVEEVKRILAVTMDDPPHCHFRVLDIDTHENAAAAYRRLMLLLHPDKRCSHVVESVAGGPESCDEAMHRIQNANKHISCMTDFASYNVKLHGLHKRPDLNGQIATLEQLIHDTGRWRALLNDGSRIDLKSEHFSMNFKPGAHEPAPSFSSSSGSASSSGAARAHKPAPSTTSSSSGSASSSGAAPPTASRIVSFGKHKGKTYGEVQRQDPSYCSWVLKEDSSCDRFRDLQIYLRGL